MRDVMLLHQIEHVIRPRTGAEHDARALHHETLHAGAGQRQVMADRQDQQQAALSVYFGGFCRELRIQPVIVMGPRDQLRYAGRAAGQLEHRRVGRIDLDRIQHLGGRRRPSAEQIGEGLKAVGRIAINDALRHARVFSLHPCNHGREFEITLAVGGDTHLRLGDFRELAELMITMGRQRAYRDRADLLQREIEIRKLDHIRQHHDHAVERP